MENSETAAIAIRGLRKTYGSYAAVEDVTFSVPHGRVVGLLGPNGAGKTTTLRMLLGLARADSGEALVNGQPFTRLAEPTNTIGALLDEGGLHPGRTGRMHLRIAAEMASVAPARVDAVLAELGMTAAAGRKISTYSLGMRQRIGLAAALIGEPQILVLDEPANGLDPAGIRWLRDRLRAFAATGGAVLISSHVLSEIAQVADDIVVIAAGRVLAAGSVASLTASYGGNLESFYLDLTAESEALR